MANSLNREEGLCNSIKAAVDILINTKGVEVASPFRINAIEVLETDRKGMLWLTMLEAARLTWMLKQVENES